MARHSFRPRPPRLLSATMRQGPRCPRLWVTLQGPWSPSCCSAEPAALGSAGRPFHTRHFGRAQGVRGLPGPASHASHFPVPARTRALASLAGGCSGARLHPAQAPPRAACLAPLPSPCGGAGPGSPAPPRRLVVDPPAPSWLLGGRGRAACPSLTVLHAWPTGDLPAAGETVRGVRGAGGRRPAALPAPRALRALRGQGPRVRLLHRPAPALVTAASPASWCHQRRDHSPARRPHGLGLFLADPDAPRGVKAG